MMELEFNCINLKINAKYSLETLQIYHMHFQRVIEAALQTMLKKPKEIYQKNDTRQNKSIMENQLDKIDINFILDGELIAFKNNRPLPFQELQKRLRRKNTSKDKLSNIIPVCYVVYDIMFFEKRQVIKKYN